MEIGHENSGPKHADGGWGWMVVVGTFLYYMIQVGTHKALGVLVPEFTKGLGISVGAVGISCGLAAGLRSLLGPVWAACALFANTRTLTFLGGILTGVGFIVAGLSTNEFHLTLSMVISSFIFDATGSYNWAYYSMAGAELCAAFLIISFNYLTDVHATS
ncbi:monocarboxylate transporter 13-like [Amphiura filiformis]|uniref:monocarboxylate transporter 13-like n=1 Tax=Amphiura filiformis TaxID=82378 RepID=UPI003B216557